MKTKFLEVRFSERIQYLRYLPRNAFSINTRQRHLQEPPFRVPPSKKGSLALSKFTKMFVSFSKNKKNKWWIPLFFFLFAYRFVMAAEMNRERLGKNENCAKRKKREKVKKMAINKIFQFCIAYRFFCIVSLDESFFVRLFLIKGASESQSWKGNGNTHAHLTYIYSQFKLLLKKLKE